MKRTSIAKELVKTNIKIISFMLLYVVTIFGVLGTSPASAMALQDGNWTQKEYRIKGGWSIENRNNQTVISFDKHFKTKKGPDLKVFLSKRNIAEVNGKNATTEAVLVSVLKHHEGKQEYVLPAHIDINDYESLLIHCEAYSVLWGGSAI